jgi:hypothetical protein
MILACTRYWFPQIDRHGSVRHTMPAIWRSIAAIAAAVLTGPASAVDTLDHAEFGSNRPKDENVIDSGDLARDAGGNPAQRSTFPHPALEPPQGAELVMELGADGVQIYSCEATDGGFHWAFAGPAAALFDAQGRQVGIHDKGPTWTLFDGSSIVGAPLAKRPAPQQGAIPWLLLAAESRVDTGALGHVTHIRRIDTRGGVEPAGGCDSAHSGEVARIRYSATYQFFTN